MKKVILAAAALGFSLTPAPAMAGAKGFTVVNATGANIATLAIRRAGTSDWKPLPAAPAAGARSPIQFSDVDCAFDLQATLANGATAMWRGVNLCEVSAVTLQRRPSGETWVDYD
jgi:hypothetical protein